MKIPVVAVGRGTPSVSGEQAQAEESPGTMVGLYEGSVPRETGSSEGVEWIPLAEGTGACRSGAAAGPEDYGGMRSLRRRLSSDVVLVSARIGGGFDWEGCERFFRELRGEDRLLLSVLAGPYSSEEAPDAFRLKRIRELPDFFLPVNTPSVSSVLVDRSSSLDPEDGVARFLSGIVNTLKDRLSRSNRLVRGLRDLMDMTRREKLALLNVRMRNFLRETIKGPSA